MRAGTCVKCGATDVRVATPHGGRPFVGGKLSTLGSGLDMDLYACMECGYMEHYVTEKGLRTLDKHGTRVPPRH